MIEIDNKTFSILNKDTDILTNNPETVQLFLSRLGVSRFLEVQTTKISLDERLDIRGHLFHTIKSYWNYWNSLLLGTVNVRKYMLLKNVFWQEK